MGKESNSQQLLVKVESVFFMNMLLMIQSLSSVIPHMKEYRYITHWTSWIDASKKKRGQKVVWVLKAAYTWKYVGGWSDVF